MDVSVPHVDAIDAFRLQVRVNLKDVQEKYSSLTEKHELRVLSHECLQKIDALFEQNSSSSLGLRSTTRTRRR